MVRVTVGDLSRLPATRLARLLMELAVENPSLLARLRDTVEEASETDHAKIVPDGHAMPLAEEPRIIGQSQAMRLVFDMVDRFARTDEPILITGESGTGKELVARAVHDRSRRRDGPFVAVNCAAIPSSLVASELFGHEKGAFTGAAARSKGQVELAHGGTLFLDEIGDMPVDSQAYLLRFLQEREITRVGGRETIAVDARIVSATNAHLGRAIAEGRFREDLYYRLNLLMLELPPLRDRLEDIEPLANHFARQAAALYGHTASSMAQDVMDALRAHLWPGNVRELMAVIRRAVIVCGEAPITPADLIGLDRDKGPARPMATATPVVPPRVARPAPGSDEERAALAQALTDTNENIALTARELGVSRVTLYRMLRRHGIELSRGLRPPPING